MKEELGGGVYGEGFTDGFGVGTVQAGLFSVAFVGGGGRFFVLPFLFQVFESPVLYIDIEERERKMMSVTIR